jgi:small GTP-binding protein
MAAAEHEGEQMASGKRYKYKLCLVGDGAVGKTSLIRKFVYDEFDDKYIVTFGTKTTKKVCSVPHPTSTLPTEVTFLISDVMGQTDVKSIHDTYFYGAAGAIIVCDITRKETLLNLENWVDRIRHLVGEIPLIFLGNKSDLEHKAMFEYRDLEAVTEKFDLPCSMTSAKTGENVEESFRRLAELILLEKTGKG